MLRGSCPFDDVHALVHEAVAPEFRGRRGEGVPAEATYEVLLAWFRRGLALGFLLDRRTSESELTGVGRSAVLTALRARSHGAPR